MGTVLDLAKSYYDELQSSLAGIEVTGTGGDCGLLEGVVQGATLVKSVNAAKGKAMFIGNGANAGICSHMSTDYWKNDAIRAMNFTDPSSTTCIGNDYGFEFLFSRPIEAFADEGDLLFAFSSSGRSPNILKAVEMAREKGCKVLTLSGFDPDNTLRLSGDLNYWVPSHTYGVVEILHHSICHSILNVIMEIGASDG